MASLNTSRTLTFTGWGQQKSFIGKSGIETLLEYDYLNQPNIADVEHDFASSPDLQQGFDIVIGWSLGALLACYLIDRGVLQTKNLVLLAPPYKFAGEDKQSNMTVESWNNNVMRGFYRDYQSFLQAFSEGVFSAVPEYGYKYKSPNYSEDNLLYWLSFLQNESMETYNFDKFPPALIFHGKNDGITNFSQAETIASKYKRAQLISFDEAGHVPHIYDWLRIKTTIDILLKNNI